MPKYYHALSKKHSFFEGWYFKHVQEGKTIAIIPGIHFDHVGHRFAFIQVITNDASYYIPYPFSAFEACKNSLEIQIDVNHFSSRGVKLFIDTPSLRLKGAIHYGRFEPIHYDIMGPFCMLPFMECHHGIISMSHNITGYLTINDEIIDFSHGTGYIETDWGRSFPKTYLWTQCNTFSTDKKCSIIASAAHIPFLSTAFQGCICAIHYNHKHYRLATYLGAKIVECNETGLILQQGNYSLSVKLLHKTSHALKAPLKGDMNRTIHECASCTVCYRFLVDNILLFELISEEASFEFAN